MADSTRDENTTPIDTVKGQMMDILKKYYAPPIEGTVFMNIQATIPPPPPIKGNVNMNIQATIPPPPPIKGKMNMNLQATIQPPPPIKGKMNIDVNAEISEDKSLIISPLSSLDEKYTNTDTLFDDYSDDLSAKLNIDMKGIIPPPKIAELKGTLTANIKAEISNKNDSDEDEDDEDDSDEEEDDDNEENTIDSASQPELNGIISMNVNAIIAPPTKKEEQTVESSDIKGTLEINTNASIDEQTVASDGSNDNFSLENNFSIDSESNNNSNGVVTQTTPISKPNKHKAKTRVESKELQPKMQYIINTYFEGKQLEPSYVETRQIETTKDAKTTTTTNKSSYQLVFPSITFELIANTVSSSSSTTVYLIAGTITNTDEKKKSRDKITHYFITTSQDTKQIFYTLKQNTSDASSSTYDFIKDVADAEEIYANISVDPVNISSQTYNTSASPTTTKHTLIDVSGFITYYDKIGDGIFDPKDQHNTTIYETYLLKTKINEEANTKVKTFEENYGNVRSDFNQIEKPVEKQDYINSWYEMHTEKEYQKPIYRLFSTEYSSINPIVKANAIVKQSPNDPIRNTFSNLTILYKYIDKIITLPLKGTTTTEISTTTTT